jgi:SAM-dependent methyltransferase
MSARLTCRSCGAANGRLVLDLGLHPLANSLLPATDPPLVEPRFPLRVFVCLECWLLQITDVVPPAQLFESYPYFSSFSETMLRHASEAAGRYVADFDLGKNSLVVEIGSNDGYLLKHFLPLEVPSLGIEPAANIARIAREQGVETLVKFFSAGLATDLAASGKRADLILGNNVLAHSPAINDFVAGLALLLKPKGCIVLEFPYACDLVEHVEFDTIYHEHVFYFTLTTLVPLFNRHGLAIIDVERLPIHGGSLRIFAAHQGARSAKPSIPSLLGEETAKNVGSQRYYEEVAPRVQSLGRLLVKQLRELKDAGNSIAAYGASAKGSTLLNYCQIGTEVLDFVADRSTAKQGWLTPGTRVPIVAAEEVLLRNPDYTLLLTWNFADEILQQQAEYRQRGGRFIIPLPEVQII